MSRLTNLVPNIIKARSFKKLRVLMLQVNYKLGGRVLFDIKPPQYKGAEWHAIYTEEMDNKDIIKEELEKLNG